MGGNFCNSPLLKSCANFLRVGGFMFKSSFFGEPRSVPRENLGLLLLRQVLLVEVVVVPLELAQW